MSIQCIFKGYKRIKAEIPVLLGESMNGYEIADIKKGVSHFSCGIAVKQDEKSEGNLL